MVNTYQTPRLAILYATRITAKRRTFLTMKLQSLIRIVLLVIVSSLTLAACSGNKIQYDRAKQSFKKQNYYNAFVRLYPLAEKGNPDAQYAVGFMYYYGRGVVENKSKAYSWIHKAATQGQPEAVKAWRILKDNGEIPVPKR